MLAGPGNRIRLPAVHSPVVGHPGIEPGDYRCIRAAPSTSWAVPEVRKMEVSSLAAVKPPRAFKARCRAGGAPSIEESGGPDPQRVRPAAFEAAPAALAGSLSISALRPGVNRPEMEEDGRLERQRLHARPVSGRGQPPDWFIFRGRRAT
jgi:hypothetical protein